MSGQRVENERIMGQVKVLQDEKSTLESGLADLNTRIDRVESTVGPAE